MSPLVEVRHLHKQYNPPDGVVAVQDITFDIQPGELFSLLGPNGAGKTTTISMLSCLLTPTKGQASIAGFSITEQPNRVKRVIGVVPQEIALYDSISARENLQFWGKMYGLRGQVLQERIADVLEIAGLTERAEEKVGSYSGGMKRRINIAVGLLHKPKLLFMDEPTVGIDPQSRRRILDTIKRLNEEGLTVVYTTHYMEEAEELSHRIGIIDHGQLIALGSLSELTQRVGQYDTIRVTVDGLNENGTLLERFNRHPAILRATQDGDTYILQAKEANAALPEVVSTMTENGRHIKQLAIQEPNLEALFLHLTGRALRD